MTCAPLFLGSLSAAAERGLSLALDVWRMQLDDGDSRRWMAQAADARRLLCAIRVDRDGPLALRIDVAQSSADCLHEAARACETTEGGDGSDGRALRTLADRAAAACSQRAHERSDMTIGELLAESIVSPPRMWRNSRWRM